MLEATNATISTKNVSALEKFNKLIPHNKKPTKQEIKIVLCNSVLVFVVANTSKNNKFVKTTSHTNSITKINPIKKVYNTIGFGVVYNKVKYEINLSITF